MHYKRKGDRVDEVLHDVVLNHVNCLEHENKRLREALEFYGDRSNYGKDEIRSGLWVHNSAMGITFSNISQDDGEIARKALDGDSNE